MDFEVLFSSTRMSFLGWILLDVRVFLSLSKDFLFYKKHDQGKKSSDSLTKPYKNVQTFTLKPKKIEEYFNPIYFTYTSQRTKISKGQKEKRGYQSH